MAAMRRTGLMGVFSPHKARQKRAKEEGFPLLTAKPRSFDARDADRAEKGVVKRVRIDEPDDMMRRVASRSMASKRYRSWRRLRGEKARFGLYCQYFAVGVIYGGLPATMFGVFLGWMNVPGYVYATASTLIAWPWSLKFVFGAVNDCLPICGYRRKPYMVLGWFLCALALFSLASTPLPEPFWCYAVFDDGRKAYVTSKESKSGLSLGTEAIPCNPDAPLSAGIFTFWMTLASFGYCASDCAADGLTVTLARREPIEKRGHTQTTVYLVRTLGNIGAVLLVGLGMNSWQYNGTFQRGLSFQNVAFVFAVVACLMIPISWIFVYEPHMDDLLDDEDEVSSPQVDAVKVDDSSNNASSSALPAVVVVPPPEKKKKKKKAMPPVTPNLSVRIVRKVSFAEYRASVWQLLRSRAMLSVLLYQLFTPLVGGIYSTAAGEVKQHWARVKVLQNASFSLVGLLLFSYGLHVVKVHFLGVSWRRMTAYTTIFLNFLDMPFTFLTVFNVIRNQYFFLGEILVAEIPAAANFVISTFVVVEMSESGSEGLVYGLLTTTSNLGAPVAQAISDQLFSLFQPSLSDPKNYLTDSPHFRQVVALSFTLSYVFAFASLLFLPLLPDQKDDAQRRKKNAPARDLYAYVAVAVVILGLLYSFTINALAVYPRTSCLRIVGGPGCQD